MNNLTLSSFTANLKTGLFDAKGADTAANHLTEDGHVLHRIAELASRMTSQHSADQEIVYRR